MKRTIENLYIWQESRSVVNDIYTLMKDCRDFSFKDQIQRASISIMNNIAEGTESGSDAKYINFLNISRGSCSEVHSMLYLCEDFKICSQEERIKIQTKVKLLSVGIVNLVNYISKNKK
ncbi:MAG: four helix bundle protein [Bacteroidales bacterium]|nr:four helix bundle protein [Bacteroidales bacterium]MBR0324117.1 four helix bundle protein [Bacteroidales bacterium]